MYRESASADFISSENLEVQDASKQYSSLYVDRREALPVQICVEGHRVEYQQGNSFLPVQIFPEIPHSGTFIGVSYRKRDVPPIRELLGLVSSISLGSLDLLLSRCPVSCTLTIVAFG
jgi:hypothetical protein